MNQPPIDRGAAGVGQAPPRSKVLCSGLFGSAGPAKAPKPRAVGPNGGSV